MGLREKQKFKKKGVKMKSKSITRCLVIVLSFMFLMCTGQAFANGDGGPEVNIAKDCDDSKSCIDTSIDFTITVSNPGPIALDQCTVTDPDCLGAPQTTGPIDVGDSETLTCTNTGTPGGSVSNTATVNCTAGSNSTGDITSNTATCAIPECPPGDCRMTGGHVKFIADECLTVANGDGSGTKVKRGSIASLIVLTKYTVGGQIGAPQAGCCETPPGSPGRDEECPGGSWEHNHHEGTVSWDTGTFTGGFAFHSGTASAPVEAFIKCIICADKGWCVQARCAPFKQIFWSGTGVFHNIDSHTDFPNCEEVIPQGKNQEPTIHFYEAHVADFGEPAGCTQNQNPAANCDWVSGGVDPGSVVNISAEPDPKFGDKGGQICDKCADYYEIEIHCTDSPTSPIIYRVGNFLTHGNYQIHPQVGQQCPPKEEL